MFAEIVTDASGGMGIGATTLLTAVVGAVVALLGAVGARQLLANYDGRKTAKQKGEREERVRPRKVSG